MEIGLLWWLISISLNHARAVFLAWALVFSIATLGILKLEFETTAGSLLNRSGEAWERYQESLRQFGGDEIIVVAVEGPEALGAPTLALVGRITEELERVPSVRRVDSVYTVPIVRGSTDGALNLDPAIVGEPPASEAALERVRLVLLEDRVAPGTLLSEDGKVLAINVLLEHDVGKQREVVVGCGVPSAWQSPGLGVRRADIRDARR